MSELAEEIEAIEAIYPECVQQLASGILGLAVPNHEKVVVQLAFPAAYPAEKPTVIQVSAKDARKYPDEKYIETRVSEIIERIFLEDSVIIFELLGEIELFLEEYEKKHEDLELSEQLRRVQIRAQVSEASEASEATARKDATPREETGKTAKEKNVLLEWVQSEPIVDRGSTFIAFARQVSSVSEADRFIEELTLDRKIARSSHNMSAMRIKGANGVVYQDCDDDGETAAGLRMLHLLTVCF